MRHERVRRRRGTRRWLRGTTLVACLAAAACSSSPKKVVRAAPTIPQSTDRDPVGPLRSVRPTDPFLVRPLGAGLFAYSGGTRKFVDLLHATSMIDVGESARGGAYYRRGDKRAPHNLYSSTARLYG